MRASGEGEEGRYLSKRCLKPLGAPLRLQESGLHGAGLGPVSSQAEPARGTEQASVGV